MGQSNYCSPLSAWPSFDATSSMSKTSTEFGLNPKEIEVMPTLLDERIDMLRSVCASKWQVFRMVKVPSALPFIFAGLDSAIVLSLLGAVVGEFIGAQAGLGNLIIAANARMDAGAVFAILVVLGLSGFALHTLLVFVQRRVVFWSGPPRRPKD